MANLANLVINQDYPWVQDSNTHTEAVLLAANVPENITVPTDSATGLKAGYVLFGAPVASDFYARVFNAQQGQDRVTNGTFAEYVTNGVFTTDTGWTKGTGWTITGGAAVVSGAQTEATALTQTSAITLLPNYIYTLTYTTTLTTHVTNGTFASDTAWTKGAGWTIAAGVANAAGALSTALSQDAAITLVEGRSYTVVFDATAAAGTVTVSIGGTAGTARSTTATFTEVIVAGATQVIAFTGAGFTGTIDNVVVTALGTMTASIGGGAGTGRTTAATFIEGITSSTTQAITFTADANFVGTIDNATISGWVLGTGWTTDGTTAIATGAISTALSQTANPAYPIVVGQSYLVTYTATRSAGTVTISLGGTAGTARSSSATFAEILIAGSTQAISFGTSGFTGTIDDVTIKAIVATPADSTTGYLGRQNPEGFAIPSDGSYVSVVSAGTPIITASFYKR